MGIVRTYALPLATAVLGLSLLAPSSAAAPAADPYPRSVPTVCQGAIVDAVQQRGEKNRLRFQIRENSSAIPATSIRFTKMRKRGKGGFKKVGRFRSKRYYKGDVSRFAITTTKRGRYKAVVVTQFGKRSQFRRCRAVVRYRVR